MEVPPSDSRRGRRHPPAPRSQTALSGLSAIQRTALTAAPRFGLDGGADEGVSPEIVATFGKALTGAGAVHEFVTYPGAPHGLFDQGLGGHEEACADAWRRVTDFIAACGGGR